MSADFAARLLEIALGNAALATLLALAAYAAARWTNRPALVHGLCLLALLELVTPPLFELPVLPATAAPAMAAPIDAAMLEAALALEPMPQPPARQWPAAVLLGLLAGTAGVFVLWWVRGRRFRRLLDLAQPAPAALRARAADLAARVGLRHAPQLLVVPGRLSPMLCPRRGRPFLLLPAQLLDRLSAVECDSVLLHELAHVQRRDHWVRRLEALVVALYWWLPLVWWLRRALREAEEQCCDAWVVWALPGSARAYAGALLSTVDFLAEPAVAAPQGACGVGPVHDLKKRLVMIMEQSTPRGLGNRGLTVLALAACMLPALPTRAQERNERGAVREAKRELDELRQEMDSLRAKLSELRAGQEQGRSDAHAGREDQDRERVRVDFAERLHEQLREQLGPEVEGKIREAMKQVHEHLEHVDGDVREHVHKALEEARVNLREHLGPESRKRVHEAMQHVHEHLQQIDGEVGEHVREALEQARAELREHVGPEVQKEIAKAMKEVHEHLGHVDGEVRQDAGKLRERALDERIKAARERARRSLRAKSSDDDDYPDEQRVIERTAANEDADTLRSQIEQLEQQLIEMRAKLRAVERRK